MIFIMMGPQACGKGTQGEMLGRAFNLPVISSGQLLRDVPKEDSHYELINKQMEQGILVDQKFVAGLIVKRTSQEDCANGYILDGWMRSKIDVDAFLPDFDFIIYITLPRQESIKRITGRRMCDLDGKTYNIYTLPPEELARCRGNLTQRADDTEEAVNKRLEIFYTDTIEVINNFKTQNKVIEVSGEGTPEQVFASIIKELELRGIKPSLT